MEEHDTKFVEQHHLEFLDDLRDSGVTNMFGAIPYIKEEYEDLSKKECSKLLSYWMNTFNIRLTKGEVK